MSPFVECRRGLKPLRPVVMEAYLSEKYESLKRFRITGPCGFYGRLMRRNSFSFFSEWLDSTYGTADHETVLDEHTVVDICSDMSGLQQSKPFDVPTHENDTVDEATTVLDGLPKEGCMFHSERSMTCSEQLHAIFDQNSNPDFVSSKMLEALSSSPRIHSRPFSTSSSSSLGQYRSSFNQDGSPNDEPLYPFADEFMEDPGHSSATDGQDSFLMMQNIPHHVTGHDLIDFLHSFGFEGCYAALYVPMNLDKRQSKGYAFIGMSSHRKAEELRQCWHKTRLFGSRVRKPVSVKFASRQGFAVNVDTWARQNTRRIRNSACKPQFFTPTRF